MRPDAHRKSAPPAGRALIPHFVLAAALLLTAIATYYAWAAAEAEDRARFADSVRLTRESVKDRLAAHVALLRAGAALFASSRDRVSREQFRVFFERQEVQKYYPGVQGIGFSARVGASERDALVERVRREGLTDFQINPDAPREEYHAIIYLEPLDRRNRAALGYDMFTEPVRRAAMERARDSGVPAVSGRVTLVQEIEGPKQAGFLIYLPVYRAGASAATTEERRAALEGFVYSPFRAGDLLNNITDDETAPGVSFEVYDGDEPAADALLHRSAAPAADTGARSSILPSYTATVETDVAGRTWTLRFATTPAFDRLSEKSWLPAVPLAGLGLSLALFFVTRAQSRARAAAEEAAESLKISERRFRTVIEQSPLSKQVFTPDGRTIRVNRAWEKLWGVTLDKLGDYNILEDQQLVEKGIMPYIRKGFAGEVTQIPPILYDPEETIPGVTSHEEPRRWVQAVIYPVKDDEGRIREVVLVHEDITERRRAEEELRANEERYRSVTETASDAIVTIDEESRIVFVNSAAQKIFGHEVEEMLGESLTMLMPEYLRHVHRVGVRRYLDTGEKHISWMAVELPGLHKDGRELPLELSFSEFSKGGRRYFTGVVRDISERKRAEEALREAERHALAEYETLLERLAPLAQALGTARDLRTIYRALLDFAHVSMPCDGFFIALYEERRDARVAAFAWGDGVEADVSQLPPMPIGAGPASRAVRTGQIVFTDDYLSTKKSHPGVKIGVDNGRLPRSTLVAPMTFMGRTVGTIEVQSYELAAYAREHATALGMAGNLAAVAIENVRLFELERRARDEAEAANRLKDEFLATLSHELRTPMTAILGWARLLNTTSFDDRMRTRAVESIERNARAQTQLIDDLLDVSRIITGKLRLDVRPIELAPVIESAADSVRTAAEAKSLQLRVLLDPSASPVLGDPDRLQQVVWNLLSNAIKFTPEGGRVEVRLARVESHAEVSVSDTGAGIAHEFLPHVFDRFRQADGAITRRHGGLGLGLAIARHLAELHGGTIHASSEGLGRGATFTFSLPLLAPARDASGRPSRGERSESAPPDDCARLEGVRVLVVDDDEDARELLHALLARCGARVTLASSAAEALEAFRDGAPDVLVSDIGMPEEDGYELIRRVRSLSAREGGETPAAALTAYARDEDRREALRAGYQEHVAKPIEPAELTRVIATLAGRDGRRSDK